MSFRVKNNHFRFHLDLETVPERNTEVQKEHQLLQTQKSLCRQHQGLLGVGCHPLSSATRSHVGWIPNERMHIVKM